MDLLQKEIKSLKYQLTKEIEKKEFKESCRKHLAQRVQILEKENQTKDDNITQLRLQIDNLTQSEAAVHPYENHFLENLLRKEIESLKAQVAKETDKKEFKESCRKYLAERVDKMESECKNYKGEINRLRNQVADLTAEKCRLEKENTKLLDDRLEYFTQKASWDICIELLPEAQRDLKNCARYFALKYKRQIATIWTLEAKLRKLGIQ